MGEEGQNLSRGELTLKVLLVTTIDALGHLNRIITAQWAGMGM